MNHLPNGFTKLDNATDMAVIAELPNALVKPYLFLASRRSLRPENRRAHWAEIAAFCGRSQRQTHEALTALAEMGIAESDGKTWGFCGLSLRIPARKSSTEKPSDSGKRGENVGVFARKSSMSDPENAVQHNEKEASEVREVRERREASEQDEAAAPLSLESQFQKAGRPELDLDDSFDSTPDLPSQERNNLAPVPPETHPANGAQNTVPNRDAAGAGEAQSPDAALVFFHDLAGPRLIGSYAPKVPKWFSEYSPEFIRQAWQQAPLVKGAHLAIHAFAWLLNREREWPDALLKQYKADLKAAQTEPENRVPVLGEILVCGPNSGRVLEIFHADKLVSIQTGSGPADYLTVPWGSTQPAVRRSA